MPAVFRKSSIGGVAQYVLGQAQNVFGDETERDNYATANPDWLQSYDDNPLTAIEVGGTFYNRVNGDWNDLTFLIGVAGDSEILSNVSSWNYPVKQPDGTFADGELTLNPTTLEVSTPSTFRTGVSLGIKLKDTHAISSVGENISFSNLVSNTPFTIGAWSDGTYGGDWRPTARLGLDTFDEEVLQPVFDTTVTNPDYNTPATGNRRTYGFYYKGAAPQQKVKIEVFENGKEIFESKLFDIVTGDGFVSFEVAEGGSGFVDLLDGVNYQVVFSSTLGDVQLLGNYQGVPYLALKYQLWETRNVCYKEELDNPPRFSGSLSGATFNISATEQVLTFNQTNISNNVTLNNGTFTVAESGFYEGNMTINLDVTGAATSLLIWIERFVGGVWAVVPQSLATLKSAVNTTTFIQLSTGVNLEAGQAFRIKTQQVGGGLLKFVSNTTIVAAGTLVQPVASIAFKRTGKKF